MTVRIDIGTIDKIQTLIYGFLHASILSKPVFIYTAVRHFFKYVFKADLKPRELTVTLKKHPFVFKEFSGEIAMFNQIYMKYIYSREDFHRCHDTHGTIIDVGANIGMFTVDIAATNPGHTVYSFEPNPDVFRRLEKNIAINDLSNVHLYNIGLSDTESAGYLNDSVSTVLGRITFEASGDVHPVKLSTLDRFIAENQISSVDILKIDVEGFEYLVLQGAQNSLEKIRIIMMECEKRLESDVIRFLEGHNFRLVLSLPTYNILYFQNNDICPVCTQ